MITVLGIHQVFHSFLLPRPRQRAVRFQDLFIRALSRQRTGGEKFVLLDDEVFILKLGSVFKSEKAIEKIAPIYCMSRPPLCRGYGLKNGRNFQNKTQCGNPSLDEKR